MNKLIIIITIISMFVSGCNSYYVKRQCQNCCKEGMFRIEKGVSITEAHNQGLLICPYCGVKQ